jgi:beta-lactam-binding protein with PASTA domain
MVNVIDKPCVTGKNELLAVGLLIGPYPDRKNDGVVTKTDPAPGTKVKWNDSVQITCTLVTATASATAAS